MNNLNIRQRRYWWLTARISAVVNLCEAIVAAITLGWYWPQWHLDFLTWRTQVMWKLSDEWRPDAADER